MEKLKSKLLRPRNRSRRGREDEQAGEKDGAMSREPTFPTGGFQHWAVAFIVCNFNVDIGPEIEILYPPDVPFTAPDLSAICFNSFPEQQNTETAEDLAFNFSITNNSPNLRRSSPTLPHGSPDTFFGSCIFRQEFDDTMKRSFNQRTLVMISHHNFPAFFNRLLQKMAATGAISNPATLAAAYSAMLTWPAPSIGRQDLPFLGTLFTLDIAPHRSFPLQGLASPVPSITDAQASIYAYEPVGSWDQIMHFMPCITDLWILYEKLLLCESIIVIAKSPQLASEATSSLLDLITPIPYAGIVKPYLTMQADFRSIGIDDAGSAPGPVLLGITNPFLLKRILAAYEAADRPRPHILYLQPYDAPVPTRRHHSIHHKTTRNSLLDLPGGGIEAQSPPKRFLKPDASVVGAIDAALRTSASPASPSTGLNGSTTLPQPHTQTLTPLIRRHFAEITATFLAPIARYLATTPPSPSLPSKPTPYSSPSTSLPTSPTFPTSPSRLGDPQFDTALFLKSLAKHGSSVAFRGQSALQRHRARDAAYEAFCGSENLREWVGLRSGGG